jgi:hypothetical protein
MEQKVTKGSRQGHPRVHDYNPQGEERRSDDGRSETEQRESRVRFIDEEEQRGDGPQDSGRSEERLQQRAKEAGTELWSFARAWTDSGSVALGTATHFFLSWQRELAEFFSMRVDKDLQFGRQLFGARHLNEWVRLNSEYAREMVFDYAASVCDIMEQSVKNAQQRSGQSISRAQEAAEHLWTGAERAAGRS